MSSLLVNLLTAPPSNVAHKRSSRPPYKRSSMARRDADPPAAPGRDSSVASVGDSSAAPTLRLFVALELPAPVRAALLSFREAAADPGVWRPVAADALHLTLAFLGRRPESDVRLIEPVLRTEDGPAPRLALAGAVLLPPRRARVLCAEVADPDGTLAALQARVSDGLEAAGVYRPEKRPFRAHATVARIRPRVRPPRAVTAAPEPLGFHGEAVTLFVSHLHPHGARYEPLVRVPLHAS
jgi:RNA 2',3'-cyclic 3'-phosphodiesterase